MFRRITGGALLALAALTLGGCALAPSRPLSFAESALQNQISWFSDANIVACSASAVLGGGICVALSALGGNAASCSASAVAGCDVTVGANQYMQHLRREYATREQSLRDVIGRIREDNQHAVELVATSQQVINEDLQRIEDLEKAKARGHLSLDAKQWEVQSLDARLAQLQDVLPGMDKKVAMYQGVSTSGYPEVGPEIKELIEKQNTLKRLLEELLRRRNVFAAGGARVTDLERTAENERRKAGELARKLHREPEKEKELREKLVRNQQDLKDLDRQLAQIEERFTNSKRKDVALQAWINRAKAEIRRLNQTAQVQDLKRFRSNQAGDSDALAIEITSLEGQLAQLPANTTKRGAEELEAQLEEERQEKTSLLDTHQRELGEQRQKLQQVWEELRAANAAKAISVSERQRLKQEKTELVAALGESRTKVSALEAETKQLEKLKAESSVRSLIDNILERMKLANIAFSVRDVMFLGETRSVELLLGPSTPVEQLKTMLEEEMHGHVESGIKVSERMEAHLTGVGFQFAPITPASQAVSWIDVTQWKWDVTPIQLGTQRLHLTLNATFEINGSETTRAIRTFPETST